MTLVHSSRTPMLGARQRLGCCGLSPCYLLLPHHTYVDERITFTLANATGPHPDTDDESVRRSTEAYLLWLFGFIMFKNGTSNSVDKVLIPYAREIADAPEDAVPLWSWGSAVLAATYRGLCNACSKDESNARFQGCALLLQLLSYERLAVGRPIVDHRGYEAQYYGQHDDDGPTMGTLWVCPREARRTYPSFIVALDRLVAEDVIWEPYSAAAVGSRAPYGLSSLCTSNETLWYTTASLIYDIYIEPHCPHRAMRQFGYAQQFPVPRVIDRVTPQDHRLSRLGQPCSGTWVTKVEPYVQAWDNAHHDVVHPVAPHIDWWYETFLTWYRPRTRCHVTYADTQPVPHESSSTDAYARHRDEALAGAMQICCQLQSNTNDALRRVRGGNPFTLDERLRRLTAANESLVSMMHAWGYSIPPRGSPRTSHRFLHEYTGT
ncbi:LOW QUALITY PROTEIN: hypothetical protein U9M48_015739 [Paspalum notatum var. saurae]|uniref:Aminotransferase-like plant mobile domain-containing protein n=1 Tax=Paspalum notatum var. saurae TaxID=547442 RepID=A0AAQ3T755_PASNO